MTNLSDLLVNYQSNDTLNDVTSRGATTTNDLTIGDLISDKIEVGGSTVNAYRIYADSDETNPLIAVFNHSNLDSGYIAISANGTTDFARVRLGANADDMVLFAGGSERMRIDSSGNVGIGTDASISQRLHVLDTDVTPLLLQRDGATSDAFGSGLLFGNDFSNNGVFIFGAPSSGIRFGYTTDITSTNPVTAGTEVMRIDASGNVGIGNTSPVTKLYVTGSGTQTTSEVRVENTSTTQNGRGVVRVKSNTSTYGAGIFATNNDETAYGNNVFGLYTFDNQDLVIGTNNIQRMHINGSDGYVGIGTSDPQHLLDINCGATAAPTYKGWLRLSGASAVNSGHGGIEFVGSFFQNGYGHRLASVDEGGGNTPLTFNIRGNVTSWSEVMRITTINGGRVGIKSTAPPSDLHVGGTFSLGSGNSQSLRMRAYGSSDTDITGLIGGSTFGGLILGASFGHCVIGLQENDDNDSFAVISGGGTTVGGAGTAFTDDNTFDYTCMRVLSKGIYNTPLGTSGRDVNINSAGILGYYSSLSAHKGNVTSLSDISWLYNLNPVSFNYKQQDNSANWLEELQEETSYGLIAEEVETINTDFVFYDGQDNLAGVDYKKFTAVLIKALQDHKSTIQSLETRIAALEAN